MVETSQELPAALQALRTSMQVKLYTYAQYGRVFFYMMGTKFVV